MENQIIDLQIITDEQVPSMEFLTNCAAVALQSQGKEEAELVLRIVEDAEMQALNRKYRGKDKPTNVLSFRSELPDNIKTQCHHLGDIVIAAGVVNQEAKVQGKTLEAHWAHMVVHGVLHLLGYDHTEEKEAERMEQQELAILVKLGFSSPY